MTTTAADETNWHHGLGYFERLYDEDADPWGFDRRWYERRKYGLTLALLPRARYRRAVEPGCANGTLTELLADRCDEVLAYDAVPAAVERARERLADRPNVHVVEALFPGYWPPGSGDLVVWSEIAYYLTTEGADAALRALARWLEPGGTLVAVHYTGETDYPRSGRSIGRWLDGATFLRRVSTLDDEEFSAGVWERVSAGWRAAPG
jgi:SAM-dependent methyltransferase